MIVAGCAEAPDAAQENAAVTDVEVLPADESAATSAGAAVEPSEADPAASADAAIPVALHGRWGLTPNDCEPGRSDAKGLVTITSESITFYESVARPDDIAERSPTRIRGEFAFIGEGMTWSGPMTWSVEGDKLTRIDSELESRLVYTRC